MDPVRHVRGDEPTTVIRRSEGVEDFGGEDTSLATRADGIGSLISFQADQALPIELSYPIVRRYVFERSFLRDFPSHGTHPSWPATLMSR